MSDTSSEVNKMSGEGYLVVRVSTASGAIPLQGAQVTVRGAEESNKSFYRSVYSGASGLTEKIALPAPERYLSEAPSDSSEKPYALYSIDVFSEGYRDLFLVNVPIFDTITSIQGANMIPKPDNEYEDNFMPYDSELREGEDYSL